MFLGVLEGIDRGTQGGVVIKGRFNLIVSVIQLNAWFNLMKQCNEMVRVGILADW